MDDRDVSQIRTIAILIRVRHFQSLGPEFSIARRKCTGVPFVPVRILPDWRRSMIFATRALISFDCYCAFRQYTRVQSLSEGHSKVFDLQCQARCPCQAQPAAMVSKPLSSFMLERYVTVPLGMRRTHFLHQYDSHRK